MWLYDIESHYCGRDKCKKLDLSFCFGKVYPHSDAELHLSLTDKEALDLYNHISKNFNVEDLDA